MPDEIDLLALAEILNEYKLIDNPIAQMVPSLISLFFRHHLKLSHYPGQDITTQSGRTQGRGWRTRRPHCVRAQNGLWILWAS